MYRKYLLFAVVIVGALSSPLRAEKASMSPAKLRETATHVVTGQVTNVYQKTEIEGDWKYTRYVAEIRVRDCEKGNGVNQGDLVYVRYWKRAWAGSGQVPTSASGHRGLPSEKEVCRVYLARNAYDGFSYSDRDNGFNVIGPNGFEELQ